MVDDSLVATALGAPKSDPVGTYLPKNADFRQLTQDRLDAIAAELNGRPRQTLGFQTPSQVLAEALP
jgi:IS30 family transposase